MIRLSDIGVLAKPTPASDYQMLLGAERVPLQVPQAAARWLQVLIDSCNPTLAALERIEGCWWLFRAEIEPGVDLAGRCLHSIAMGRPETGQEPRELVGCLLAGYQEPWSIVAERNLELRPAESLGPLDERGVALALLSVIVSEAEPVLLGSPASAVRALELAGVDRFRSVSLVAHAFAAALPAAPGIVIVSSGLRHGREQEELLRLVEREGVDLPALLALGLDAPRARELLLASVGELPGQAAWSPADAGLDWLLASAKGRDTVFVRTPPGDLMAWSRAGRIDLRELVAARDGSGGPSAAAVALLDERGLPPAGPPRGWSSALRGLLAEAAVRPEFWSRWHRCIKSEMVRWVAYELASEPGGVWIEALAGAMEGTVRLELPLLRLVADALPDPVTCGQCLLWNDGPAPDREEALQLLLAPGRLRPALRQWLRGELLEYRHSGPPPELTVPEMLALFPLLHPIRDILRPIVERERLELGEELLFDRLEASLRRVYLPVPPLPPPGVRLRRPRLIERLACIPGWERWQRN